MRQQPADEFRLQRLPIACPPDFRADETNRWILMECEIECRHFGQFHMMHPCGRRRRRRRNSRPPNRRHHVLRVFVPSADRPCHSFSHQPIQQSVLAGQSGYATGDHCLIQHVDRDNTAAGCRLSHGGTVVAQTGKAMPQALHDRQSEPFFPGTVYRRVAGAGISAAALDQRCDHASRCRRLRPPSVRSPRHARPTRRGNPTIVSLIGRSGARRRASPMARNKRG